MVTIGIILLVVGALVAWLAPPDVSRIGYIAAVIGLILIVLGVLLEVADEGDELDADAVLLLPLMALKGRKLR